MQGGQTKPSEVEATGVGDTIARGRAESEEQGARREHQEAPEGSEVPEGLISRAGADKERHSGRAQPKRAAQR